MQKFLRQLSVKAFPNHGFFIVTGSNLIRPDTVYRATILCNGYSKSEEKIYLRLRPSKDDKKDDSEWKKVTLSEDKEYIVDFELKNITENDYVLEVKNGGKFEESRTIKVNQKKHSVYVQTDKSIYKPADNIKFRVLILDAETRPFNPSNVEIFITDGGDNRIKQFDKPEFENGVFSDELQLSDLPVMGNWKIHAKVDNGEDFFKIFEVNEYVLPKFEVMIETNPDIHYKYGKIRATVKAKYTFGKLATGLASVTAHVETKKRYFRDRDTSKTVTKNLEVDGKNFVEFDLEKDLGIHDSNYVRVVTLESKFKEHLSGKEATTKTEVTIHMTPHKIDLKKSNEKFKPGLPYNITAFVRNHDKGTPVTDSFHPVNFKLTLFYDILKTFKEPYETYVDSKRIRADEEYEAWEEQTESRSYDLMLHNGTVQLNLGDLDAKYTHFDITAKYQTTEARISNVMKVETESNQYIMANVVTENPTLSKNVSIQVLSTVEISQISYAVFGRGSFIEAKALHFQPTKCHTFDFKPSINMIPKAQLIVKYFTSDGEIISDRIEIHFGNELKNHIDIKLSTDQVKPGSEIGIDVSTQPNSYVSLLGVDQSVLLLKKGNDIEASTVFEELLKYGNTEKISSNFYAGYDDFKEANAIVITNAKKQFERKLPRRGRHYPYMRNMYLCSTSGPSKVRRDVLSSRMRPSYDEDEMCLSNRCPRPDMDELKLEPMSVDEDLEELMPKREIEIRKEFPETWLWENLDFKDTTIKKLSKKVPDTITSWIITGFSVDPLTGLGLTKQPSKFNVFQPFFVSTNLPYSIKRGEVVSIPIIVFNYLDQDQKAEVTFFNEEGEFVFIDNHNGEEIQSAETKRSINISIKSNEGSTASFMIRPLKVGDITIKVTANSALAGDGIERQLKVEPEGVTQFMNDAVFIDLRTNDEFKKTFEIDIPEKAVPDSTHIEVSAIGDILGPSIENLDKLIKLPYGCGEQNMLNFVPNIVVLQYLISVDKLTPEIKAKTKKYMETGYQKELTYKHDDGSYSAFGKYDNSGSTWLTAFVARSFHQATQFIKIEQNIIKQALSFLCKTQSNDGSFKEVGRVLQKDMQGGASKGIALTAYILITFIENDNYRDSYKNTIQKAIDYIVANKEELDDTYSLAVTTYAFHLANHSLKDELLAKLEKHATNANNMKYWTKPIPPSESSNPWYCRPFTVNVEMSAYALQAFVQAGRSVDAVSIMKWLITQRNENGGFASTQDTVVGIQALAKLASKIYSSDGNVEISVKSKDTQEACINVNSSNALVLQKFELSPNHRKFEVVARGKGFCIFQVSYRYNLDDAGDYPRFNLNPVVQKTANKEELHLTVSTNFVPDSSSEKSNMAVMEVTLPSGFTFDSDHLSTLLKSDRVKKVETKFNDTVVMVYFDDIDKTWLSPDIKAYRTHKVAKQKPAPVVIYDYYDNSRRATTFYSPPEISIADICVDA